MATAVRLLFGTLTLVLDPRGAGHGSVALHVVAIVALFLVVQWGTAASARSVVWGRNTISGRGPNP